METWKEVKGFGGHYEASSFGRIKSRARTVIKKTRHGGLMTQRYEEKILQQWITSRNYRRVHIGVDGKKKNVFVHQMVLLAFSDVPSTGLLCRHLNGDSSDNRPGNLAWGTDLENAQDRKRHGRYASGTDHPMAKFDGSLVRAIKNGSISHEEARKAGVSTTHYYRLKKQLDLLDDCLQLLVPTEKSRYAQ